MADTKLANKETLKRLAKSTKYWVSMIATAFNVEYGEGLQVIYINELMKLDPKLLEIAANRTIREWDKPAMMPPLAFILERAVPPLPDGNALLDREWSPTAVQCDLCQGDGQLAAFFTETIVGDHRERKFEQVMGYHRSQGFKDIPAKWIRYYFRCTCPAGDRRPIGLPRWKPEIAA